MENTFSVGGVLKEAYAIMQPKFWKVIGQFLLIFFALQVLFIALFGRGAVIGSIITAYIGVKWALSYVRKGSFSFDCIFEHLTLKKFVYYVCAIFLVGLSVIGGFILLVIPGIIFATRPPGLMIDIEPDRSR